MTQYLVAIHRPENYDPSTESETMVREIGALNQAMEAAGVRLFAGGLSEPSKARALRAEPDGKVRITDGPYLETKELVGGFWILETETLDDALAWAAKAVTACRASVEVRPFVRSNVRTAATPTTPAPPSPEKTR